MNDWISESEACVSWIYLGVRCKEHWCELASYFRGGVKMPGRCYRRGQGGRQREATPGVMEGRSAGVAVRRVTSPTLSLRVRDIWLQGLPAVARQPSLPFVYIHVLFSFIDLFPSRVKYREGGFSPSTLLQAHFSHSDCQLFTSKDYSSHHRLFAYDCDCDSWENQHIKKLRCGIHWVNRSK